MNDHGAILFPTGNSREKMSDLIVVAFADEAKAEEVRKLLFTMQKHYLLDLGDAVVVVKNRDGKISINLTYNLVASGVMEGVVYGGLWGLLIGVLFFTLYWDGLPVD